VDQHVLLALYSRSFERKETAMAGKGKFAERMTAHLNEPIDAACPISRTGGTVAQIGGTVGGVVGAAITGGKGGKVAESDIKVGQFGWLGLGSTQFAITDASFSGKPKGDPLVRAAYTDVTAAMLTEGKLTLRADLDLADGRHIAMSVLPSPS
jgi:hypothetical protein